MSKLNEKWDCLGRVELFFDFKEEEQEHFNEKWSGDLPYVNKYGNIILLLIFIRNVGLQQTLITCTNIFIIVAK
jgi:hypothetical protein